MAHNQNVQFELIRLLDPNKQQGLNVVKHGYTWSIEKKVST